MQSTLIILGMVQARSEASKQSLYTEQVNICWSVYNTSLAVVSGLLYNCYTKVTTRLRVEHNVSTIVTCEVIYQQPVAWSNNTVWHHQRTTGLLVFTEKFHGVLPKLIYHHMHTYYSCLNGQIPQRPKWVELIRAAAEPTDVFIGKLSNKWELA